MSSRRSLRPTRWTTHNSQATAVWDTVSHVSAGVVFSNTNHTALCGAGVGLSPGAATKLIAAGQKIYFEGTLDVSAADGNTGFGVGNASNTWTTGNFLGISANGIGYYDDGFITTNNVGFNTGAVPVQGNTICVAVIGGSKIWFRINGGNWLNDVIGNQNPATGVGGRDISGMGNVYPAYSLIGTGTRTQYTGNFGGPFLFTMPSGFTYLT